MKLLKVEINDFMIFGKNVSWQTPFSGSVLVKGQTSDTGNSNETGKSTLFESIMWCLSGSTVRKIYAQEVVRLGETSTTVSTEWEINGVTYQFTRFWSKATKYVTIKNLDDPRLNQTFHNSDAGTAAILELFGTSADIISLIGFFGKKFSTFSRMGLSERADLLDLLANGNKWESLSTRLASTVRDQKKEVALMQTSISELESNISESDTEIEYLTKRIQERLALIETRRQVLLDEQSYYTDNFEYLTSESKKYKGLVKALASQRAEAVQEKQDLITLHTDAVKPLKELQEKVAHSNTAITRLETLLSSTIDLSESIDVPDELKGLTREKLHSGWAKEERKQQQLSSNIKIVTSAAEAVNTLVENISAELSVAKDKLLTKQTQLEFSKEHLPQLDSETKICSLCKQPIGKKEREEIKKAIKEGEEAILQIHVQITELTERCEQLTNEKQKAVQEASELADELTEAQKLTAQYINLRDEYNRALSYLDAQEKKNEIQEKLNFEIAALKVTQKNLSTFEETEIEFNEKIRIYNEVIEEITVEQIEKSEKEKELLSKISIIQDKLNSIKLSLSNLKSDSELQKLNTDMSKQEATRAVYEKELKQTTVAHDNLVKKYAITSFWANGFKAIRFMLMEKMTNLLQETVTAIALNLGLRCTEIRISLFRETTTKKTRPQINLEIIKENGVLSLGALSEGATQRVDLACFIAIGKLVSAVHGLHLGFRVFDEPLAGLDADGKLKVFNLINELHDTPQKFIIDHDANFNDLFSQSITVYNKDGQSTIIQ